MNHSASNVPDPGKSVISDRTVIRFLRVTAIIGSALALIGSAAIVVDGHVEELWSELSGVFVVFSAFFAVVVWLVTPHQPRNPVVWTMTASAFFSGLFMAGLAGASRIVDDPHPILLGAEKLVPADLPQSATLVLMFTEPAVVLAAFPLLTFGFLLFPDGSLPSPRWRWVGWLSGVSLVVATVAFAWGFRPASTGETDLSRL